MGPEVRKTTGSPVLVGLCSTSEGFGDDGVAKTATLLPRASATTLGFEDCALCASGGPAEIGATIAPLGVAVTRLAYGLPIGGDLDYADEITLSKSLEGRTALS